MSLWLMRAGSSGEYESRFLTEKRMYFNWSGLLTDLGALSDLDAFYKVFGDTYPDAKKGKVQNNARQGFQFSQKMQPGDWVALPSKFNPTIHFGKITGPYQFDAKAEDRFQHSRSVEWFAQDIPRDRFDQDILYSLGAFLTVCRIQRNNAEERVKEMAANGWKVPAHSKATLGNGTEVEESDEASAAVDIEQTAMDQISRLILAKFKGHGLANLVKAILQAQGYTVHQPPAGPDHGVDLLAAPGPLGFGKPRICVQVKSSDTPVERVVLDQLIGTMQNFQAEQGLLISWGGFKQSVERERATQFFRVRLWNRNDLIENLLAHYDALDEDLRSELPLKRIWTITNPAEE
ncbi:MAG: restriction endonuclease [Verrucomicrobiales bacterium VVV1]|nr:MAG: restriction endonuclease [Verrucomicrobiales bacterium VVV1]